MLSYKDALNESGLKATPQRLMMVALLEEYGHMTIEEMYDHLKAKSPSLSLSTVYNNVYALSEKGIVKEVATSGSKQLFELIKADHAHLICSDCGMVSDMMVDFEAIKTLVSAPSGTKLFDGDLIFSGVCAECVKEKEQQELEVAN